MKVEVIERRWLPKRGDLAEKILALNGNQALKITDITKKEANAIRQQLYRVGKTRSKIVEENGEIILYLYKDENNNGKEG